MSEKLDPNLGQAAPVSESAGGDRGVQEPWLPLHHEIIEVWRAVLGVQSIGIRDSFFELGGDSQLAVDMLLRLEEAFQKTIPISALKHLTVEHLAEELCSGEIDEQPPILKLHENGSAPPLFYLHGDILGGGFYCRRLATHLGGERPFYVLPPAGAQHAEISPGIEEMASAHIRALRDVSLDGRYALGGFCDGGLVAYEMARQLNAIGKGPSVLLLIDTVAPPKALQRTRKFVQILGSVCGMSQDTRIRLMAKIWHPLERFLLWWRTAGSARIPDAVKYILSLPKRILRRIKARTHAPKPDSEQSSNPPSRRTITDAYLWATAGYKAQPYSGRLELIMAAATRDDPAGSFWGWNCLAKDLRIDTVPGGHLEAVTTHVEVLAAQMNRRLGELTRE